MREGEGRVCVMGGDLMWKRSDVLEDFDVPCLMA